MIHHGQRAQNTRVAMFLRVLFVAGATFQPGPNATKRTSEREQGQFYLNRQG